MFSTHVRRRGGFRRRGAFTLIELLVVMVILAILATLTGVAAVKLIETAKITATKSEIETMSQSLEAFKLKYGVYPPNVQDTTAVTTAWRKMFPRATEQPPTGLTSAEGLVFWLGGFGPDPTKPIASGNAGTADDRRDKFFDFSKDRLSGTYPKQTYVPPYTDIQLPYVYFDVSRKLTTEPTAPNGTLKPYKSDASGNPYMMAGKFQIICAGVDNDYGTGGLFPSGASMGVGDSDNFANFAPGKLDDAR